MSDNPRERVCTWCHGKGFIKRDYDPTPITKGRWIGFAVVIVFISILSIIGGASGWWSLAVILLLIAVFGAQFIADIVEEIGFWRGKKVTCPHCGGIPKDGGSITQQRNSAGE